MLSAPDRAHRRHITHENVPLSCRTQPQVHPSWLSACPKRPDNFEQHREQLGCYLNESAHRPLDPSIHGASLISDENGSEMNDRMMERGTHALHLTFQTNKQLPYYPWAKSRSLEWDHPFHAFRKATSREFRSDIPADVFFRRICKHANSDIEKSRESTFIRKLCHHFEYTLCPLVEESC